MPRTTTGSAAGPLDLGALRRTTPVDQNWGYERGTPIDRVFVERFIGTHAVDVRGRVVEIAAPDYTTRYGIDVERVDILMAKEGNPEATIVRDLTDAPQIPSDTFDCVIVTQTLQFVFDIRAALTTIHRILAPGGVLLATVPGITKISPLEDEEYGEWWHYTGRSARRLAEEAFGQGNVEVQTYGNVLAAAGFLYGLAAPDLRPEELALHDPLFEVIVAVRAVEARLAASPPSIAATESSSMRSLPKSARCRAPFRCLRRVDAGVRRRKGGRAQSRAHPGREAGRGTASRPNRSSPGYGDVAPDDGQPRRHLLEHRVRASLARRAQHPEVGGLEQAGDVVDVADEERTRSSTRRSARGLSTSRLPSERPAGTSVNRSRLRLPTASAASGEQRLVVLADVEVRQRGDHDVVVRDTEAVAPLGSARADRRALHPVRDHADAVADDTPAREEVGAVLGVRDQNRRAPDRVDGRMPRRA